MYKALNDSTYQMIFNKGNSLYNIEPIGVGSSYVESLSSYIARLAFEHNLPTGELMKKVIMPKTKLDYLHKEYRHGIINVLPEEISSKNIISFNIVQSVEKLNGRSGLELLTLLPLKDLIRRAKISNDYKKWCPYCLNHLRNTKEVYEPLIWQIKYIKNCPIHNSKLVSICPNCSGKLKVMGHIVLIGFCSKCNYWLGSEKDSKDSSEEVTRTKEEIYFLELLDNVQKADINLYTKSLEDTLVEFIDYLGLESKELANLFEVKRYTISSWYKKESVISFDRLIQFSINYKISIFKVFIVGDYTDFNYLLNKEKNIIKVTPPKKTYKIRDSNNKFILNEMSTLLIDNLNKKHPQTITGLSTEHKVSRHSFKKYFPKLYELTVQRAGPIGYSKEQLDQCKKDLIYTEMSYAEISEKNRVSKKKISRIAYELRTRHIIRRKDVRLEDIKLYLEKVWEENIDLELSMKEISIKLNCTLNKLKRASPDIYFNIKARNQQYNMQIQEYKQQEIINKIKEITITLHEKGIYPKTRLLIEKLNYPSLFQSKIYREYFRSLLKTLGYK